MRPPRRTAFANAESEVPHLYSLLYPPPHLPGQAADAARHRGVSLVQTLYLSRSGGCPLAIEATASLVAGVLLDHSVQLIGQTFGGDARGDARATFNLNLRQTLSLCVIRLVNSLADALQSGKFARSIASIAEKELNLPQWLVEFRHRATHEDLPSIEVCREAVGTSLTWLQSHYWAPTLRGIQTRRERRELAAVSASVASTSAQADQPLPGRQLRGSPESSRAGDLEGARAGLLPILASYKRLSKETAKDHSLKGRGREQLEAIFRELDDWLARWGAAVHDHAGKSADEPPSTAAEVLLSLLLTPGVGFVPLSKLKRPQRGSPQLSGVLQAVWTPLIDHLDSRIPGFAGSLLNAMGAVFAGARTVDTNSQLIETDDSYARTLQAWMVHLLGSSSGPRAKTIARTLLMAILRPPIDGTLPDERAARTLRLLEDLWPLCASSDFVEAQGDMAQLQRLLDTARRLYGPSARANGKRKQITSAESTSAESEVNASELSVQADSESAGVPHTIKRLRGSPLPSSTLLQRMEERYAALLRGSDADEGSQAGGDDGALASASESSERDGGSESESDRETDAGTVDVPDDEYEDVALPPGWSAPKLVAPEAEDAATTAVWAPTPIGCFKGRVPDFLGLDAAHTTEVRT
ncbi:unnamed protein product [Parajaminaea phylloscopi]